MKRTTNNKEQNKNLHLVVYLGLILFGMVLGLFCIRFFGTQKLSDIDFIANNYISVKSQQGFIQTISYIFSGTMIYVLWLVLLAFCAVSLPLIILTPVYKGFGLGVSLGYLYALHSFKGLLYSSLFILPSAILNSIILCYVCKESMALSTTLFTCIFKENKSYPLSNTIKIYLLKMAVYSVIIFGISILQALITLLFAGIIKL